MRVQTVGLYQYHKAGAVQADVGKQAFILDDNMVSTVATVDRVKCGMVGAGLSLAEVSLVLKRG